MICIVTIVERGKANAIVDKAKIAGAKGATIFYGRGTGEDEIKKYFNFHIESSKEAILIISQEEKSKAIIDAIVKAGNLEKPGKGILFTFSLINTIGIS
ncbi:nitrogen regulatory protein PII [Clostridium tetanomorphum]|uniref:P-II family nitrogen regulator n=1 Tax=Clostridium tetanomorphum TaxID=1553 RepID=UPI00044512F1|nr:P-II family nitrogen regulator [Clostridium tetanomorphum]KAJ52634.1 nitrogen regulatory protein P-II [Clostridium tetanomorphum DSM 665]MBP1863227.1 nitrogen regulatory protein PII [Clostridium tetanomorphum]NRS84335.1 nitrogen regulatory protein PII [Clostridium tetanomorphum]NRZ97549.1 nitrogen regulatory protein PII [Clostridium tetanomorphum]SQB92252.1 nitrogen regulatory protein P-II [Clostridium tetanomorphum]